MMELSEPHQRQEDPRQGACEEEGSAVVDEPVAISVEEALNLAHGSGRHYRRVCSACLLSVACGGMGGAAAPFVLGPVTAEGSLGSAAEAMLGSAMFVGMWLGSFVGGALSDAGGPGRAMAAAVAGLVLFGAAPAALPPAAAVAILGRLMVGFSLVITYQAGNTYLAESVPTRLRGAYLTALHIAIAIGGLATVALATVVPREAWRLLLLLIALATVGVFAVVGPFVLAHESPRWLLVMGKENNARALLRKIAAKEKGALNDGRPLQLRLDTGSGKIDMNNGAHCADGAGSMGTKGGGAGAAENPEASLRPEATTYASWHHKLPQLRHHALWRLHAAGCLVTFCLNFGAKGAEIWLGTYIDELGVGRNNATLRDSASTSAGEPDWLEAHFSRLIYFGLISGKIIGDVVNLTASQAFGRLWCLRICFWGAGVCVLLVSQVRSLWVLLLLTTLQGAFQDMLWCNIYMYLAEAFPTSIRSTAFGLSMGIGRSGGVVSSALGGAFNSVQLAFVLYGAAFIVGGVIVSCLGNETSGRPLRDAVS